MSTFRKRLTFANVVSVISLVFAVGLGGAWAATELQRNDVTSRHIKNGGVRGVDLANDAVTSPKVANGTLLGEDFASGQLAQGERGEPGEPGADGQDGSPDTPLQVLDKIKQVDGEGSGRTPTASTALEPRRSRPRRTRCARPPSS